ncbi:hypothetical protein FRB93_013891 [Tulasnella sp. JGI-2019a]|nr:hypothetical protein FRB93_013891 [Tulasnella sp. JGI-2019a]
MGADSHQTSHHHTWSSSRNSIVAGASAGFVSSVVTCPLDVIKTKLQAQKIPHGAPGYLGIAGTTKDILLRDGFKGLYRGLGPTMLGYLPTWAIYFTVYDGVKDWLGQSDEGSERQSNAWSQHILASMTAGATGTVLTSPLWVVKTRFMTQHPSETRFRHTIDAFRIIYCDDGIRAFYRGLIPSLLGVSHVAVQFPLYEYLKDQFALRLDVPKSSLPSYAILTCTAISKLTATLITYPHEVVRTRLQIARRKIIHAAVHESHHPRHYALHQSPMRHISFSSFSSPKHKATHTSSQPAPSPPSRPPPSKQPPLSGPGRPPERHRARGTLEMAQKIYREGRLRAFYKGLTINLVRTIPNSAVTLLTYELVVRVMNARTVEKEAAAAEVSSH